MKNDESKKYTPKAHEKAKIFLCEICKMKFTFTGLLICELCSKKALSSNQNLKHHISRCHKKSSDYQSSNKTFSNELLLLGNAHDCEEKPFISNLFVKSFIENEESKNHTSKALEKVRLFCCEICKMEFTFQGLLICELCSKVERQRV